MIWWWAAAVLAFFVKGLTGFGDALVFGNILSFRADTIRISPVELLISCPSNLILSWKGRRSIRWRVCLPIAAVMVLGDVVGIFLLKNMNSGWLKVGFGILICALGAEMLLRDRSTKQYKQNKVVLAIIGILSGIISGVFGVGALLAAYINRVTDSTGAFKSNICTVFSVENLFRIVLYSATGIITGELLWFSVQLLPAMLIGLALGALAGKVLDEAIAKKAVILMLIVSGTALILTNL